jgi:2-polyprenyl-3-methyl-5-hydroxy-6-metoxy-1,4-benzoquinol methylase
MPDNDTHCFCGLSATDCGRDSSEVVRTKIRRGIERNVLKCPSCDLVYLEPKKEDLQEFYREQYRKDYSPSVVRELSARETFDMYRPFMGDRVDRVAPHLSSEMRVLEIGCATGHFLDSIRSKVGECVGIEYNESHAAFVREELGFDCHTVPIQESGIEKGSIDMVFMFHVFEHVEDPVEFLKSILPYLTDDGRIYVEVPNVDDALIAPYAVQEYADFYYREPHLFYFSPDTFEKVTTAAGFTGEIEMVQRYSLLNHMHWVSAHGPMDDAESGMAVPTFKDGEDEFTTIANEFLARVDAEYRALLKSHGRAEAMVFNGQVSANHG